MVKIKFYLISLILWIIYGKEYKHIQLYAHKYQNFQRMKGDKIIQDRDLMKAFKPFNSNQWYDFDLGIKLNPKASKKCEEILKNKQYESITIP